MNHLDIQCVTRCTDIPSAEQMQIWVDAVLTDSEQESEIVVRLVDEAESAELNSQYRHKLGSTNILSFPFEAPEGFDIDLLGDLVICAPLIAEEAIQQHKPLMHHWAHILIHGVLHLIGYDHIQDDEAEEMEALEIRILSTLSIDNPYLDRE